jgi:hypothetical protein
MISRRCPHTPITPLKRPPSLTTTINIIIINNNNEQVQ